MSIQPHELQIAIVTAYLTLKLRYLHISSMIILLDFAIEGIHVFIISISVCNVCFTVMGDIVRDKEFLYPEIGIAFYHLRDVSNKIQRVNKKKAEN